MDRPLLGRFSNPISMDTASKPIMMYEEQIEIMEEEPEDDIEKNAEYWAAKKKKKKNRYVRKTKFNIEDNSTYDKQHSVQSPTSFNMNDSSCGDKVHFEGFLTNNNTVDAKTEDNLYKYVIMQVVNNPVVTTNSIVNDANETVTTVSTTMQSEVSITPVGEWVDFRYPSVASADVFLGQIDDDFESQERARKQANERYKAISSALVNRNKDIEEVPSSFGVASSKRSYNRKKLIASLESHGGDEAGDGFSVKATGNAATSRRRVTKEDDSEYGAVHADAESSGEMTGGAEGEQGVDFEEVFDDDDEMMGGAEEQEAAERDEASSKTKRGLYQAVDSEDDDGSGSEEEEEEELKEEHGTGSRQAEMVAASARELKWHLKQQQVQQQRARPVGVNKPASTGVPPRPPARNADPKTSPALQNSASKRPRDETDYGHDGNAFSQIKKKKLEQHDASVSPTIPATHAPSSTSALFLGDKFEFNDAGMKAQIKYAGGKITAKDLAQVRGGIE